MQAPYAQSPPTQGSKGTWGCPCGLIFPQLGIESGHMEGGLPRQFSGKESTCQAGDAGLIPGLGRSPGKGNGNCLQYRRTWLDSWISKICWRRDRLPIPYSWASLVAQLVKNQPAMWETWVRSLGWEDPLKKGKVTHSSILAWRLPWPMQSLGQQRVRRD